MRDTARALIDEDALDLRKKLASGHLYGEQIDINDKNMCIVGAYALGQQEAQGGTGLFRYGVTPKPVPPKPATYVPPRPRPHVEVAGRSNHYFEEPDCLSETRGPIQISIDRLAFQIKFVIGLWIVLTVSVLMLLSYLAK